MEVLFLCKYSEIQEEMKRGMLVLWVCCWLGLAPAVHAQDVKMLTAEMETVFKSLRPAERKALAEGYAAVMTSPDWPAAVRDSIAAAFRGLQGLHVAVSPELRNFVVCVNSFFRRGERENLEVWLEGLQRLLSSTERKRVEVKAYLEETVTVAEEQVVWDGSSHRWWVDGRLEWKAGVPLRIDFQKGNLMCSTRKDTICIRETSGTYLMGAAELEGSGGFVQWDNGEAEVTADLSRYVIQLKLSGYAADSVLFHHEEKYGRPLAGQLKDNALKYARNAQTPYPEFASYDLDISLLGIFEQISFRGGVEYRGRKFFGTGTAEHPALLHIVPNDTIRMELRAKRFDFDSLRVVGGQTAMEITMDSGQIVHRNVTFSYSIPQRAVSVKRISEQSLQAPFRDTYHQILFGVEEIYWQLDSAYMEMRMSSRSGLFKASIESMNFFSDEVYDDIQGLDEVNPLNGLLKCSRALGENTFTLSDYAGFMRKPVDQLRRQIVLLSYNDFVDYNEAADEVTLKRRLFDYTKARVGKQDYDNIRFLSSPDRSRVIARFDVRNYNLHISGVEHFLISRAHNIYVEPFDGQVVMMKNRDMLFNGKLNAGVFNMYGRELFFSYDKYTINLPQVDSAAMFMAGREGQGRGKRINSLIREIEGEILIDSPDNKAGKKREAGFPVFNSTKESYVYFDEPAIQGGQYHRDSFYYCIAPYTIKGINNADGIRYAFDGTLYSNIVEPIRDTLRLLEDNALGLKYETPADGLRLYGKGRITSRMTLNRRGFIADGKVDMNGSHFDSDTILLLPARMTARTKKIAVDAVPGKRPAAGGKEVGVEYVTANGVLHAQSTGTPFDVYAGRVKHTGSLLVSDRMMDASGRLTVEGATLDSRLFHLRDSLLESAGTALNFTSVLNKDIHMNTSDVAATIDLAANKGTFVNNAKDNRVDFTSCRYSCSFMHATWYMQEAHLNIGVEEPSMLAEMWRTEDEKFLPHAGRNMFISTNPALDSLRFIVPLAKYDLKEGNIECRWINHIDLANGRFYPADGDLSIATDGTIAELEGGKLLCDRGDLSKVLTGVSLKLVGRNRFSGSGNYLYVSEEKKKIPIRFSEIGVDTSRLIFAKAALKEEEALALNDALRFKGDITLFSRLPHLHFSGYAGLTLADTCLKHNWVEVKSFLDAAHIRIPVEVENHNDARQRIYNGIYLYSDRAFRPYAAFLGNRRFYKDDLLIGGKGTLEWSRGMRQYVISDTAVNGYYRFRYDPENSAVSATGQIDCSLGIPGVRQKMAGDISFDLKGNRLEMKDLLFTLDFPLTGRMETVFLRDFAEKKLKTIYAGNRLKLKLYTFYDKSALPHVEKQLGASSNNVPDSLDRLWVFDSLRFEWVSKTHSYVANGQAHIVALRGKPVEKTMNVKMEMMRSRGGNQLFLYVYDDKVWYYFEFSDQSLYTLSSDEEYNEIVRTEKPEKKMMRDGDGGLLYTITICPPSKKERFLQRVK